jgi:hypothetical protein
MNRIKTFLHNNNKQKKFTDHVGGFVKVFGEPLDPNLQEVPLIVRKLVKVLIEKGM